MTTEAKNMNCTFSLISKKYNKTFNQPLDLTHQVRIKIKNVEFDIFVFNGLSVVKI
jgi:hypothetical protein